MYNKLVFYKLYPPPRLPEATILSSMSLQSEDRVELFELYRLAEGFIIVLVITCL